MLSEGWRVALECTMVIVAINGQLMLGMYLVAGETWGYVHLLK